MTGNVIEPSPPRNAQEERPMWMVLHGGAGAQRFRFDGWAESVVEWLTATGCWIAKREGSQLELRHKSRVMP